MNIETVKEKTAPIFKQYGVIRAAVFGSVARGTSGAGSDVDFLVNLHRPFGLIQFVALKRGLESVLKKSVDMVEYDAIKPALADNILKDATIIYEQR
jgi:predicted nucleotidyltransferase